MDSSQDHLWPRMEQPFTLPHDRVQVFRLDLEITPTQYEKLHAILSEEERARAARFRFHEPRQRFVACRGALRQILSGYLAIDPTAFVIQYGEFGKPTLAQEKYEELGDPLARSQPPPGIQFNVSHSRNLGLIAISSGIAIGVDIEECNPTVKILKLAERFFAPSEAEELKNLPVEKQLAGFFRGWTCKEAYIKATGLGLSQSLSSFCVVIDPDQPAALRSVVEQHDEPARWTIQALNVAEKFAAAVMAAAPNMAVDCWSWEFA